MNDTVIKVENLSKQYRLGEHQGYKTFREAIVDATKAPAKALRSMFYAPNSKPYVPCSKLSLNGETIWALKDISFNVKRGEVIGIIGRNGAGKSTLLKILSKITEPTTGRIVMKGRVGSLLEIGTGFHPELTGHENIYLYGAILGMDRWEVTRKFDEIVEFAELQRFIETPVKRYSSGMYMRLAFAVSAFMETGILVIDEVLAVGDFEFQKRCLGRMKKISKEGRTIIFVSHNMAAIQTLCQRAIYLIKGEISYDGRVDKAITNYLKTVRNETEEISLEKRIDRVGGQNFRFKKIQILDERTKTPLNLILSGQSILIRVEYILAEVELMKNVSISIAFFNQSGSLMFACRSDVIGKTYKITMGQGYLTCKISKWPLTKGTYSFNIIAYNGQVVVDWVKDAGYINVEFGDYYKTGRLPAPKYQSVLVDYKWD